MVELKEELRFLEENKWLHGYNRAIDEVVAKEFDRLGDTVYLDHAGATLYSKQQIENFHKDLLHGVYGNPHSRNASSCLTSDTIEQVRYRVLDFFNTNSNEYSVIFTPGCTAALKLLSETFDFTNGVCQATVSSRCQSSAAGIKKPNAGQPASERRFPENMKNTKLHIVREDASPWQHRASGLTEVPSLLRPHEDRGQDGDTNIFLTDDLQDSQQDMTNQKASLVKSGIVKKPSVCAGYTCSQHVQSDGCNTSGASDELRSDDKTISKPKEGPTHRCEIASTISTTDQSYNRKLELSDLIYSGLCHYEWGSLEVTQSHDLYSLKSSEILLNLEESGVKYNLVNWLVQCNND
ncbi:uncharacterized protein LOC106161598 [Lingula anatina]|uniref:Uncharacterized protein LOC106161598 n=1 Tax=Lingula anatina TaxID=7574 RepID=A0A1S3I9J2_LINAN|nr:uncharacterized protein LOC106161598 [Lingula anatina]|eukprot:XP_013394054.1 uncharacterized protein LOC106161598 [Lingula anatina]